MTHPLYSAVELQLRALAGQGQACNSPHKIQYQAPVAEVVDWAKDRGQMTSVSDTASVALVNSYVVHSAKMLNDLAISCEDKLRNVSLECDLFLSACPKHSTCAYARTGGTPFQPAFCNFHTGLKLLK